MKKITVLATLTATLLIFSSLAFCGEKDIPRVYSHSDYSLHTSPSVTESQL